MDNIQVVHIKTKKEINTFCQLPLKIYKNSKFYVPNFISDEKNLFNPHVNLYLNDTVVCPLLVYKNNKCVGRVYGLIQPYDETKYKVKRLRFTCFDVINDQDCFNALFNELMVFAKTHKCQKIIGPIGFNDTEREGLLIEGFETMGTFVSNYNYPYYQKLLENYGFVKDIDWYQYRITREISDEKRQKISRVAKRVLSRNNLKILEITSIKETLMKYGYEMFDLINSKYEKLYGTVPIDKNIVDNLIKNFLLLLKKELFVIIVDQDEKMIGFCFCFPSISKALIKSKGKLLPFGIFRVLKSIKKYDIVDFGLIAVREDYKNLGLNAVLMINLEPALFQPRVKYVETNLMLENNLEILSMVKHLTFTKYRTNRAFTIDVKE